MAEGNEHVTVTLVGNDPNRKCVQLTCNDRTPYAAPIFRMVRHNVPKYMINKKTRKEERTPTVPSPQIYPPDPHVSWPQTPDISRDRSRK